MHVQCAIRMRLRVIEALCSTCVHYAVQMVLVSNISSLKNFVDNERWKWNAAKISLNDEN